MLRPIYTSPCHPPKALNSFKTETQIILKAPPYSRAYLVKLGLEGGKQASLGFLIVSRAWFGIIFVFPLFCISHYFYIFATVVMRLLIISFMFLVIITTVYFDYILSIARLSLYLCICSYSVHSKVPWVSCRHCVSMVLIRCLPADTLYISGHEVDRRCDTPVEFFVVHSPNIGIQVGSSYEGR
jgi:hypothetical protein